MKIAAKKRVMLLIFLSDWGSEIIIDSVES